jgi:hypothetical protein
VGPAPLAAACRGADSAASAAHRVAAGRSRPGRPPGRAAPGVCYPRSVRPAQHAGGPTRPAMAGRRRRAHASRGGAARGGTRTGEPPLRLPPRSGPHLAAAAQARSVGGVGHLRCRWRAAGSLDAARRHARPGRPAAHADAIHAAAGGGRQRPGVPALVQRTGCATSGHGTRRRPHPLGLEQPRAGSWLRGARRRQPVGARYSVHVMRPARTHGSVHRVDPVAQPFRQG